MGIKKQAIQNLFGLYIHWPYCLHKCPYCDFASCVSKQIDEDILITGYLRDMDLFKDNRSLSSIFFGGGTPSLMTPHCLDILLNQIQKRYSLTKDIEITMEANPDTVDFLKLKAFRQAGINRLSIGVQSLNNKDLKFLGRTHSAKRAIDTITVAQRIFDNINIDLIYARPNQSLRAWENELNHALSFQLPHYSLYQLTIEENTVFGKKHQNSASPNQARRLYIATNNQMATAHRPAYEVSNYAQEGFLCRHNMAYWLGEDYIGIGPAAHGRLGLNATQNQRTVAAWLKTPPTIETLTPKQRDLEKLLMGLRLTTTPFPTHHLNPQSVQKALQKKWIIQKKDGILPTLEGTLMLNQLILLLAE